MLENASSSPLMEMFSSDRRLSGSTSTSWQDRVCWSQQGWLLLDKLLGDFENNSFEEFQLSNDLSVFAHEWKVDGSL